MLAAMPIHGLLLAPMGCRNKDVSKGVATLLVLLGGGLSVLCARLSPATPPAKAIVDEFGRIVDDGESEDVMLDCEEEADAMEPRAHADDS